MLYQLLKTWPSHSYRISYTSQTIPCKSVKCEYKGILLSLLCWQLWTDIVFVFERPLLICGHYCTLFRGYSHDVGSRGMFVFPLICYSWRKIASWWLEQMSLMTEEALKQFFPHKSIFYFMHIFYCMWGFCQRDFSQDFEIRQIINPEQSAISLVAYLAIFLIHTLSNYFICHTLIWKALDSLIYVIMRKDHSRRQIIILYADEHCLNRLHFIFHLFELY